MKLIVKKNMENEELSLYELKALLNMTGKEYVINPNKGQRFCFVEVKDLSVDDIEFLRRRIAYNKEIGIMLYDGKELTYKVESLRLLPCKHIKHHIEELSSYGIEMDLESKNIGKCYKGIVYLLLKEVKEHEFLPRHGKNKPGFMPFSIHPRLSKMLYNLAEVKQGKVLDPFCGVGGTALEGMVVGIETYCLEKYKNVGEKAYINFLHYLKQCNTLIIGDATSMPFKSNSFDGIVSDLPYGRASKLEDAKKIYEKFFEEAQRILKPGSKLTIITNQSNIPLPKHLHPLFKTSLYVHKSLQRWVWVLKINY